MTDREALHERIDSAGENSRITATLEGHQVYGLTYAVLHLADVVKECTKALIEVIDTDIIEVKTK